MQHLHSYSGRFGKLTEGLLLFQKTVSPFNRVSPTPYIHGPNSNEVTP